MGESVSTESQPPKLCSWILCPYGLRVKGKPIQKNLGVTPFLRPTCGRSSFSTTDMEVRKKRRFHLKISTQHKQKIEFTKPPQRWSRCNVTRASASCPLVPRP